MEIYKTFQQNELPLFLISQTGIHLKLAVKKKRKETVLNTLVCLIFYIYSDTLCRI